MKPSLNKCLISRLKLFAVFALVPCASVAWGGEFGSWVNITQIRPYLGAGHVYIEVDSAQLCGTTVFKFVMNEPGAKEAYAAALTALTTKKQVLLEVSSATGCTGWGTELQSIHVKAN